MLRKVKSRLVFTTPAFPRSSLDWTRVFCVFLLWKRQFPPRVEKVGIAERKAVGGDDQRDDDLHTIIALVPVVAELALVFIAVRGIALEIGARQIIEQDIEFGPKQVLPALPQMTEERLLVRKEFIQAAVERIFLNQGIVLPEKIPHRALLKPQTM